MAALISTCDVIHLYTPQPAVQLQAPLKERHEPEDGWCSFPLQSQKLKRIPGYGSIPAVFINRPYNTDGCRGEHAVAEIRHASSACRGDADIV